MVNIVVIYIQLWDITYFNAMGLKNIHIYVGDGKLYIDMYRNKLIHRFVCGKWNSRQLLPLWMFYMFIESLHQFLNVVPSV